MGKCMPVRVTFLNCEPFDQVVWYVKFSIQKIVLFGLFINISSLKLIYNTINNLLTI